MRKLISAALVAAFAALPADALLWRAITGTVTDPGGTVVSTGTVECTILGDVPAAAVAGIVAPRSVSFTITAGAISGSIAAPARYRCTITPTGERPWSFTATLLEASGAATTLQEMYLSGSVTLPSGCTGVCEGGSVEVFTTSVGTDGQVLTAQSDGTLAFEAAAGGVNDASYLTLGLNGTLTDERVLTAGTGITVTDGGAGTTATVAVADTAVTPGAYTLSSVTVDQQGRITAAASGTETGDISGVTAGTGLTGGGASGAVTVSLSTPVAAANGGTGGDSSAATGVPKVTAGVWSYDAAAADVGAAATAHAHAASDVTSGQLVLERGGSEADLSATGPGLVQQATAGAAFSILGGVSGQTIAHNGTTFAATSAQTIDSDGRHVFTATLNDATGDEVAFDFQSTVNKATSGSDTLARFVQTDTASPGTSYLINALVGASSKFSVTNGGAGAFGGGITVGGNSSFGASVVRAGAIIDHATGGSAWALNNTATNVITVAPTNTQTSGTISQVKIAPTYNQTSGTALNVDLLIDRTSTAVGSGAQLFLQMKDDTVEKFSIDTTGRVNLAGSSEPACDATTRGMIVYVEGGAGVADTVRICTKDGADAYDWRSLIP